MTVEGDPGRAAATALTIAEAALTMGRPEEARSALATVAVDDVPEAMVPRVVDTLARANRFLNRHRDTVEWIDARVARGLSERTRVRLSSARIAALRQIDPMAVLAEVDAALGSARAVGDLDVVASLLAHGAFCAYRTGDAALAMRMAEQAAADTFVSPRARVDALRAQLFAATLTGAVEKSLALSLTVRDRLLELHDLAGAANECNNCAEAYLTLGRADAAKVCADDAQALAAKSGHRAVERFAGVLAARALAESGDVDAGIEALRATGGNDGNMIFTLDTAAALGFWLVERSAGGDGEAAAEACAAAIAMAEQGGVRHMLTTLHATHARAHARSGRPEAARQALADARRAADSADRDSELMLALGMGEVLPATDPARRTALHAARSRLLSQASQRENPHRFCVGVRVHRRLLELSGGVPDDLPKSTPVR